MTNLKKTTAQSMSVSEEEKVVIEILALFERMKPATFVREIFYRGLETYLQDREVHPAKHSEEVYEDAVKLIDSEDELKQMKAIVEFRIGLIDDAKTREARGRERREARVADLKPDVGRKGDKKGSKKPAK